MSAVAETTSRFEDVRSDVEARNEMIVRYLPLVRHVARKIESRYGVPAGFEFPDMVSLGIFGLIEAWERFDDSRGVKFSTYAVPRIRGAIVDEFRHMDWVPRNVRTRARRLKEITAELTTKFGRKPTRKEIADAMGDDAGKPSNPAVLIALEAVSSHEDSLPGTEIIMDESVPEPGSALEESELRVELLDAMGDLAERDKLILTLYYFERVALNDVARLLGVTESRVSQLHTRALSTLRQRLAS